MCVERSIYCSSIKEYSNSWARILYNKSTLHPQFALRLPSLSAVAFCWTQLKGNAHLKFAKHPANWTTIASLTSEEVSPQIADDGEADDVLSHLFSGLRSDMPPAVPKTVAPGTGGSSVRNDDGTKDTKNTSECGAGSPSSADKRQASPAPAPFHSHVWGRAASLPQGDDGGKSGFAEVEQINNGRHLPEHGVVA